MPLRAVGYPVVLLGRAGHSIIRSPQIVSDTFSGKRDLDPSSLRGMTHCVANHILDGASDQFSNAYQR